MQSRSLSGVSMSSAPNPFARLRAAGLPAGIAAGLLLGSTTLHGEVGMPRPSALHPSNCADAGPGSLRDAIAVAASGDVIDMTQLSCSTISLTTGQLSITQPSLTLIGPGSAVLAIDGGGTQRVLAHSGGGTLQVEGVTLRNGYVNAAAATGGCISTAGSTLVLRDTMVSSCKIVSTPCTDSHGGAVFAAHDAILIDSTISYSDAEVTACPLTYIAAGGGAYVYGNLNMIGGTISGNKAAGNSSSSGGGLWLRNGGTLQDAIISGNDAPAGGGVFAAATVHFVRTTLDSNTADSFGAGLQVIGSATFDASKVINNTTPNQGGGVWSTNGLVLARDTFFAYNAASSGSAVYAQGHLTLQRSTVAYNTHGVAIYAGGSSGTSLTTITNSTIAGNSQTGGSAAAAVVLRGPGSVANSTFAFNAFSATALVAGNDLDLRSTVLAANTGNSGPNDLVFAGGTLSGDHNLITATTGPQPPDTITVCPKLDRVAGNGGVTPTIALLQGSAGIDAGSNPLALGTDQRGGAFVREFGASADIGAFERQTGDVDEAIFSSAFEAYCDSHKRHAG